MADGLVGQGPDGEWLAMTLLLGAGVVVLVVAGWWGWRRLSRREPPTKAPGDRKREEACVRDDRRIRHGILEIQHDIATGMLEGLGFEALASRAVRDLIAVFSGARVCVWQMAEENVLRLVASGGMLAPDLERREPRGFDVAEGEVRRWDDLLTHSRLTREGTWWDESGARAVLEVPLLGTDGVLGTLSIDSPEPRRWTDAEVQAAERIAASLATALEVGRIEEERRIAVEKVCHSEACFRTLFELNPSPMLVADLNSLRILLVNQAAVEKYGWSREEFLGLTLEDIRPPEQRPTLDQVLREMRRDPQRDAWVVDAVHRRRDGTPMRVRVFVRNASFIAPGSHLVVVQDAPTVRELLGNGRAENGAEMDAIIEPVLRGIARELPPAEMLGDLCRAVERAFPGRVCTVYTHDVSTKTLRLVWGESLSAKARETAAVLPVRPDFGVCPVAAYRGERVICPDLLTDPKCESFRDAARQEGLRSCWSEPMIDASGVVLGTFALYSPEPGMPSEREIRIVEATAHLAGLVLEHERIVRAARRSEERLELALMATQDGVWERDVEHGRVWLSPRCRELLGLEASRSEIEFEECVRLMHPDDRAGAVEHSARAMRNAERYDVEYRMLVRGEYRWFRARAVPRLENGRVVGLVGSLADITTRRRAEETLRALVEGTAGTTGEAFFSSLVRHLAASLGLRWVLVAGVTRTEPRMVRTLAAWDGTGFAKPLEYPLEGTPCEGVVAGQDESFFIPARARERYPDASTLRLLGVEGCAGVAIRDSSGHVIGVLGALHDAPIERAEEEVVPLLRVFAARAGAEMERLRHEEALASQSEQLRQSQRLEAVGRLASGIAHDFNNLLTAIRGYTSLASATLPPEHAARKSLSQVEEAARQASSVASSLLTFARKTAPSKQVIPIVQSVEAVCNLFRRMVPPGVRVEVDVESGRGLTVEADDTQIRQVLLNLCLNARDAVSPSGLVEIKVRRVTGEGGREEAWISVRDDGVGMAPEVRSRVFEPFFTTKKPGEGTGLGLSVAHGIVREHGGRIAVESTPGRGSVFTVALPTCGPLPPPRGLLTAQARETHRVGGSAMVIEPNPMVRGVVASMLEALGYRVRAFGTFEEAMGGWGSEPACVIVGEREPSSAQWEDFVRTLHPRARVAICGRDDDAESASRRGLTVLRKPFLLGDLEAAIEGVRTSMVG